MLSLSPVWLTFGGPAEQIALFGQFCGHVHAVIELGAGNFIRGTLFCGTGGNFASARSSVEAVELTLCAKAPKDIRERAETATKVLMDFMVVFLK